MAVPREGDGLRRHQVVTLDAVLLDPCESHGAGEGLDGIDLLAQWVRHRFAVRLVLGEQRQPVQ